MDCKQCKKLLSKFLDHDLDQSQQALMQKHIQSCPACAQSLESINEMVRMMHNLKEVNPPDDFIDNVNKKLDKMPFWEKSINAIRNFLPVSFPAKAFALAATVVLVFAVTNQLNLLLPEHKGLIRQEDGFKLSENLPEGGMGQHDRKAEALERADKDFIAGQPVTGLKRKKALSKSVVSEPASAVFEFAEAESKDDFPQVQSIGDENKVLIPAMAGQGEEHNLPQVLLLQLDDQKDIELVEQELQKQNVENISRDETQGQKIFNFNISYENYLKLHAFLAGIGTLAKDSPDLKLYDGKTPVFESEKQAFEQIIPVQLKIQK
jgi:hypothetical protein